MSAVMRPFLVPEISRFRVEQWSLSSPTLGVISTDVVEGWDPATSLSVAVDLRAEIEGALEDCALASDATLGCTLRWRSTRTGMRGTSDTALLRTGANLVALHLPGERLGGALVVQCIVHLLSSNGGSRLSPSASNAILWDASKTWTLEGSGPRFPVELLDFQRAGMRGPSAAWAVYWYHRDADGPASSSFRLRLNNRHPLVRDFLVAHPAAFEKNTLATVLRRDVVRDLVNTAIDLDDDLDGRDWPDDSLGAVLTNVLATIFPGLDGEEIRSMREGQPADFESTLQTLTAFLSLGEP